MKKILGILCVCYYLLVTVGVHIHLHYCKGNLKDFSINSMGETCCKVDHSCEKSHFGKSCCSNEIISINLESDHTSASEMRITFSEADQVAWTLSPYLFVHSSDREERLSFSNTDPPPAEEKRYQMYCSLLFYA